MISIFQYGQSLTLTLSELEEWKKQLRAELKLEIKTEIFQELPETEEDITRIDTQLGSVVKTSQEIITAVQDLSIQLQSLQEFSQEVHNHTMQIENLGAELQETNILVGNQSTELNRLEDKLIGFNETFQDSNDALKTEIIASFEKQAEDFGAELQGTETFIKNKVIEFNQTLQESNNALNHYS